MGKRFNVGDVVVVNKDIVRVEGPYAMAGETGAIEEIFRPNSVEVVGKNLYAKVRMSSTGLIKTFRLSSLNHASET